MAARAEETLVLAGEVPKAASWSKNQQCPNTCVTLHMAGAPDTRTLQPWTTWVHRLDSEMSHSRWLLRSAPRVNRMSPGG